MANPEAPDHTLTLSPATVADDVSVPNAVELFKRTITSVDAATLEKDWCAETGAGYEISPTSIVRIGDEVIMPTDKGNILAFSAEDGSHLWTRKISIALVNPMEVWTDGGHTYILASTMDGTVTLLKK